MPGMVETHTVLRLRDENAKLLEAVTQAHSILHEAKHLAAEAVKE